MATFIPRHLKESWDYVGGLATTSKMPGPSYSLPASKCITGAKLAKVEGSVCHGCYAFRGNYLYPSVKNKLNERFENTLKPGWVRHMVKLIKFFANDVFRWHDSGDLQSVGHLEKIAAVCRMTPNVKHWLPTREYKIVQDWINLGGKCPNNLVIRMSAHMIDGTAPNLGFPTSGVFSRKVGPPIDSHECKAYENGNTCGDCRACWDPTVKSIVYKKH